MSDVGKSDAGQPANMSKTSKPEEEPSLTKKELDSLRHWSEYGQVGTPPETRVIASDWRTKEFDKPVSMEWIEGEIKGLKVDYSVVKALWMGFKPAAMEDKWFIFSEELGSRGDSGKRAMKVVMCRSWTGKRVMEIEVEFWRHVNGADAEVKDSVNGDELTELKSSDREIEDGGKWEGGL